MFKNRSTQTELLDQDNIDTALLYQNLKELNFINTWLGGHQITLKGLKAFQLQKNKNYHVLEIGCGGGDNLLYLANWAAQNNYQIQFTGVDLKKECIDYALSQCGAFSNINYIHSDYRDLTHSPTSYDIIFSSLFCHHFTDNELKEIVEFKKQKSKLGYFINDLHRHPVAYYSIQFLTCLFSKSPLVKNDAPLSVLRGFKLKELRQICGKVVHINWKWAFRWLVIYKHEPK